MTKLTRVLRSSGKTINLAGSQIYQVPRKPPLNSLIFEKLPEPRCGEKITEIPKAAPVKPVRVCTKPELKAMYCPPPVCDCTVKAPPPSLFQRLAKAALLLAKCFAVGSLVYFTWAEGFWSDPDHTECIYDKLTDPKPCRKLIKFGSKILLVGIVVNYTWYEGLWSDAFRSACFLGKFLEKCPLEEEEEAEQEDEEAPLMTVYDPEPCAPYIPRSDLFLHRSAVLWNKSVIMIFWLVLEGPYELWNFFFGPTPPPPKPEPNPCF